MLLASESLPRKTAQRHKAQWLIPSSSQLCYTKEKKWFFVHMNNRKSLPAMTSQTWLKDCSRRRERRVWGDAGFRDGTSGSAGECGGTCRSSLLDCSPWHPGIAKSVKWCDCLGVRPTQMCLHVRVKCRGKWLGNLFLEYCLPRNSDFFSSPGNMLMMERQIWHSEICWRNPRIVF